MKYYEDAKYSAAFDRCVDVMSQLLQKYGSQVLDGYSEMVQVENTSKVDVPSNKKAA